MQIRDHKEQFMQSAEFPQE